MTTLSFDTSAGCSVLTDVVSGIVNVKIAEIDWIESFPDLVVDHTYQQSVVFKSGFDWLTINTPPNNTTLTMRSRHDDNGYSCESTLRFQKSGINEEFMEFNELINRKCLIVKLCLRNGKELIIGTPGPCDINPALISNSTSPGRQNSDFSGGTFDLRWLSNHKPYFID